MNRILVACALLAVTFAASADPPATSGIVTRDGYFRNFIVIDDERGMMATIGTDVIKFCQGQGERAFISFADKNIQEGLRLSTLEKGKDFFASVWGFTEFNCERILTELPLATGLVDYRMHDNDLFGRRFCDIKNNMNAFGRSFHGTLYSPFGDKKKFSAHIWGLYDCDTDTFPVFKVKVLLTD